VPLQRASTCSAARRGAVPPRMQRVETVETAGPDIDVKLMEEPRKSTRTRNRKSSARSNNSAAGS
jgi:hypothetical protein